MGKQVRPQNRTKNLAPRAAALLGKPLEFIDEVHLRERQICALIDDIANGAIAEAESIATILSFLSHELPLHLRDEEEDLFPLLQRRCEKEDEIEKVIEKLHSDHAHAGEDTPIIVALLETLKAEMRAPDEREQDLLFAYASHSRRHLILENAIILPFARLRLTGKDLETLAKRMCQRRGLNNLRDQDDSDRST